MSRAYDHWIHQQLEPNDVLIKGKHKREPRIHTVAVVKPEVVVSEWELLKKETEYLKTKGI